MHIIDVCLFLYSPLDETRWLPNFVSHFRKDETFHPGQGFKDLGGMVERIVENAAVTCGGFNGQKWDAQILLWRRLPNPSELLQEDNKRFAHLSEQELAWVYQRMIGALQKRNWRGALERHA